MKLVSLALHNFRSYADARIKFAEGQNYVFGKNWQGKSSLMDGIAYALFGKRAFPARLAGATVRAEHLVREGTTEGWVELDFELEGKTYALKRTCARDRATLTSGDIELGSTSTTVREALLELLGVDDDLFVNIFYSEQDELRKVLEITPEGRKVFIETILGFDFLKELKLSSKRASDSLQKWLDGFISGNIKTILEMTKEIESRTEWITSRLMELNKAITGLGDPRKRVSDAQNRVDNATKNLDGSIQVSSSLHSQKDQYVEMLDGISSGVCPTCKQKIPPELKDKLHHQIEHLIEQIELKIKRAEMELQKFNSELMKANTDHDESYEQVVDLGNVTTERDTLASELNGRSKDLDRMKKELAAYGNREVVLNRINEERSFLQELQEAIDEFRNKLRSAITHDLENAVNFFMTKFSDEDFDAQLRITEDFGFEILLHGHPVPLFNLSGAARDILALSIRYGLYLVASKEINFILLDEPTHHFDQINTMKLKEALNELSDQQLIIITVHDELSDAIGKKFMVKKDQDLRSIITEI